MNQPNPAIVTQAAVRRLPRPALLLFCLAYLIPGFVGRDAWKGADVATLGWILELAQGSASWLHPTLVGNAPENPALLPYWLGAWMLQCCPSWIAGDFAVRIPFALLLGVVMASTWQGTYYLARSPRAQPVAFAFGGEAQPKDYARAMADGGLLALIACLGLAQLAHETSPALTQLGCTSLLFYALAALPYRPRLAGLLTVLAQLGLSLSGAPALALFYGAGGALLYLLDRQAASELSQESLPARRASAWLLLSALAAAACSYRLDLWRWKVVLPAASYAVLNGYAQLLTWFTWPAWPLALWTLWSWRRQLFNRHFSRHLLLPAWFVGVTLLATVCSSASDRTLLLALPALAALAAFALPTLKRQVASLIDWFTLIFFSGCGFIIWVVWIAMLTGFPSQPSANVARLAPGFQAAFSWLAFAFALAATLTWAWLVHWRVGRHRAAIWKSLVLPAGGAALCWLLLMTLWMPLLNYAQSYSALVRSTVRQMQPAGCVETLHLGAGKMAAFAYYGNLQLRAAAETPACPWLIAEPASDMAAPDGLDQRYWIVMAAVTHPTDGNESVLLFKRR